MNSIPGQWRAIGRYDEAALLDARLQAHHGVQWLARAARAYGAARSDDSHTSLSWDPELGALVAQPIGDTLRLGLDLAGLALLAIGADGKVRVRFDLDGKTNAQAGSWLESLAYKAGLDPEALDAPLPWTMASHAVAAGGAYKRGPHADAFATLAHWYGNASLVLEKARSAFSSCEPGPSSVRCWPHHFDIATLVLLSKQGEDGKSVGIGFSPGDEAYAAPYFYVTPWPYPEIADLPVLPAGGHWHTQGFTAAVALAADIGLGAPAEAHVEAFALETGKALIGGLTH